VNLFLPAGGATEVAHGARSGQGTEWSQFSGDIDEAMLFGKSLSLSEMEQLYHGAYRPGTVDMDTSGVPDTNALLRAVGAGFSTTGKSLAG
jgi:hypothetical protein